MDSRNLPSNTSMSDTEIARPIKHWIFKKGVARHEDVEEGDLLTIDQIKHELQRFDKADKKKDDFILQQSPGGFHFENSLMWACIAATNTPSTESLGIITLLISSISDEQRQLFIAKTMYGMRFYSPDVCLRLLQHESIDLIKLLTSGGTLTVMYDSCAWCPDTVLLQTVLTLLDRRFSESGGLQQAVVQLFSSPVDLHSGETAIHHLIAARSNGCLAQVLLRLSLENRRKILLCTDIYNITPLYMIRATRNKIEQLTDFYSYKYFTGAVDGSLLQVCHGLCNTYALQPAYILKHLVELDEEITKKDVYSLQLVQLQISDPNRYNSVLDESSTNFEESGKAPLFIVTSNIQRMSHQHQYHLQGLINMMRSSQRPKVMFIQLIAEDHAEDVELNINLLRVPEDSFICFIYTKADATEMINAEVDGRCQHELPQVLIKIQDRLHGHESVVKMFALQTLSRNFIIPGLETHTDSHALLLTKHQGSVLVICMTVGRNGWEDELKDVRHVMEDQLDLEIEIKKDLDRNSALEEIDAFLANNKISEDHGFLFVIVLAHGDNGRIKCAANRQAETWLDMHDLSKTLQKHSEISKMLIVQCCRGGIDSSDLKRSFIHYDPNPGSENTPKPFMVPMNCFTLFSTMQNKASQRGLLFRSLRTQLYDMFATGQYHEDIADITSIVADVAGKMNNITDFYQCPEGYNSLNKRFQIKLYPTLIDNVRQSLKSSNPELAAAISKDYLLKAANRLALCLRNYDIDSTYNDLLSVECFKRFTDDAYFLEKEVMDSLRLEMKYYVTHNHAKDKNCLRNTESASRVDGQPSEDDRDVSIAIESGEESSPVRLNSGEIYFKDHPEFRPNMTPEEVLRAGSFGGTYFVDRYSSVLKEKCINPWTELPSDWLEGLMIGQQVASTTYRCDVNKYKCKTGYSLEIQEQRGFIKKQDPYGWFQWYCRFYLGRRTSDDTRQIERWAYSASFRGRWRMVLINMIYDANASYDNESISPNIRQALQQWAYKLSKSDYEKGEKLLRTRSGKDRKK